MTIPDKALTMMTKKIKANSDKRIERLNKETLKEILEVIYLEQK